MEQYISKSALVAEIERLRGVQPFGAFQPKEQNKADWLAGKLFTLASLETFLYTIEVKEVEETEQRMKECPFRQDICNRYRGTQVKCDGKCSWVVDYLKLKELKAQKGEDV